MQGQDEIIGTKTRLWVECTDYGWQHCLIGSWKNQFHLHMTEALEIITDISCFFHALINLHLGITGCIDFQCRYGSDYFLLSHLQCPANGLTGRPGQSLLEEEAQGPCFRIRVPIHHLNQCRHDKIPPPEQEARWLRTANPFSSAQSDEVCPLRDQLGEIRFWREGTGRIDQDWNRVAVRDCRDPFQQS